MTVSPLDSPLYRDLFADPDVSAVFADARQIALVVQFERALARVQGRLGVIPQDAADAIDRALADFAPDPGALAAGTDRAGVPVPALVEMLRAHIGGEAAGFVHWGATSQDAMDTALALQLREALTVMDDRAATLCAALFRLAREHRDTPVCGRTRGQMAAPTGFGLKLAGWCEPVRAGRARLRRAGEEAVAVSLASAVGSLSALGEDGLRVLDALGEELGLPVPDLPWHSRRDGVIAVGLAAAGLAAGLGKMAQDILLMAQNEVGELREGGEGRGGSSTMPNKANPTRAEAIVALARHAAGLGAALQGAAIHGHERDGAAWQTEWLTLPQTIATAAGALRIAVDLIDGLEVDAARMKGNIEATDGLVLAEGASFALARHMPRQEAQALVREACREAAAGGGHVFDILAERSGAPVDWAALRDPARHLGPAAALLDRWLTKHAGLA